MTLTKEQHEARVLLKGRLQSQRICTMADRNRALIKVLPVVIQHIDPFTANRLRSARDRKDKSEVARLTELAISRIDPLGEIRRISR